MMEGDPRYALEKFSHAVYLLATGEGDVRSRLKDAFHHFFAVREADFPDALREDYRWIVAQLTKHEAKFNEGRLIATLERIRNSTGARIAERIYKLAHELEDYLRDREANAI